MKLPRKNFESNTRNEDGKSQWECTKWCRPYDKNEWGGPQRGPSFFSLSLMTVIFSFALWEEFWKVDKKVPLLSTLLCVHSARRKSKSPTYPLLSPSLAVCDCEWAGVRLSFWLGASVCAFRVLLFVICTGGIYWQAFLWEKKLIFAHWYS